MLLIPRLRLEHLYAVGAVAFAAFVVALVPIDIYDFWWHMAIGRDILQTGQVPTTDRYSWALPPGTPFVYQSWLSELTFYVVYSVGGLQAVVLLRNLLFAATWSILAVDAWRRSGSWRMAGLAVVGVTLVALNNITVRPQMFSWLPFALSAALLAAYRRGDVPGSMLLIVPALVCLWANLHGAFFLGAVLAGLTALGESMKSLGQRQDALPLERVRWLWIIAGLAVVAPLANPQGARIYDYVRDILGSAPIQGLVVEWQPLAPLSGSGIIFALSICFTAAAWLRVRHPVDLTDLVLWAAFLWIAAGSVRYILWWGMIAWPISVGLLADHFRRRRPTRLSYANTLLAAPLLLLPLSVQPPLKRYWSLPPVFAGLGDRVPDGTLVGADTPVEASAWLKAHPLPPDARLFHDMGFGSYLIWALPERTVYIDPRIELYPLEEWLRYRRITECCNYTAELRQLEVTHVMLSRARQPDLIAAMEQDVTWNILYADDQAVIFGHVRASAGTPPRRALAGC